MQQLKEMKKKLYTHTDGRKNFFTYLGVSRKITDNRQINRKKNIAHAGPTYNKVVGEGREIGKS